MRSIDYTLYVITDRSWLHGAHLTDVGRAALECGAALV